MNTPKATLILNSFYVIEGHDGIWDNWYSWWTSDERAIELVLKKELIMTDRGLLIRNRKIEEILITAAKLTQTPRNQEKDFENTIRQLRKKQIEEEDTKK
jgi:hypothetical protein